MSVYSGDLRKSFNRLVHGIEEATDLDVRKAIEDVESGGDI